jgi:RNA polymerase sigma factor (sigma-70 family)
MMTDDMELVREYVARQSETAFETLVSRHINLVYSSALRQVGDTHLAEEVTQAVFIILSRKAGSLGLNTVLSAWLYRTTRYASADALKSQRRRQRREQEAHMQSKILNEQTDPAWERLSPLLDEAMARLGERDRSALVLRFFENKTAREIAAVQRIDESAAQKRISRALDKLRSFFIKRGITLSAAAIAGAVSANSVHAAPMGLATTVVATAAKGSAAAASTLTLVKGALKIMAWTKAKSAIVVGASVLLAAGTTTITVLNANKPVPIQGIPKDWSILSGGSDQWNWTNNAIYGHTSTGDSILASTRQYDDVTVSAMVSTTNREASLAIRFQDPDNGYLAVFVPDGTPAAKGDTSKISLLKRRFGEERELAILIRRGLSAPGQLEKFTFSAKGSRLEVRLNDITILRTNDTTFASGFIGLRVYGDPKIPCDGTFSNLTVR